MQRRFDFGRLMLKGMAIVTMTIDHVGVIVFPQMVFLRMIGRLALPLFCYLLVLGVESTRNAKSYFVRLLLFALVSQTPYFLAFGFDPFEQLNILFSLLFAGMFIYLLYKGNPLVPVPVLAAFFLNSEGGLYVIALVICMVLLQKNTVFGVLLAFLVNSPFLLEANIQALSLLSFIFIVLHKHNLLRVERETREKAAYFSWMKYAFYVYYPLHLTLLYVIRLGLF